MSDSESDEDNEIINGLRSPSERNLRERVNYLETLDDKNFLGRFRMSKTSFKALLDKICDKISSASMKDEFIFMPRNRDEILNNFQEFYDIGCFPTVLGTIDCTHIKISGQGGVNGETFRNRKQFMSINVQSVSSADLKFQDIFARLPGSVHDSHIFTQSSLKQRLEANEFTPGVLLGDGGYKLESYLMTPYRNPQTQEEVLYNRNQIKIRNTVERKYGVWKRRFPCLVFGLRCKLETSLVVIVACAVLHNFCVTTKDPMPPNE